MIKEYTYPNGYTDRYGNIEGNSIMINLKHVSAALADNDGEYTYIWIYGDRSPELINEPYERFVRDWKRAVGQVDQ